jgi:molybdopterin-guanine dinucleotide biosynthesis protein A
MPRDNSISALILAGGRATRMGGIAKHAIVVGGETILARQLRTLGPYVDEILVSSPVAIDGVVTVRDAPEHEGIGPLAGIAAGLAATTAQWMFVIAGDMPYIDVPLVERMLAARARDAVGLRTDGLPEPLLCVLRVDRARVVLDELLRQRRHKASGLLAALDVTWIDDADRRALHNINEPSDLRE